MARDCGRRLSDALSISFCQIDTLQCTSAVLLTLLYIIITVKDQINHENKVSNLILFSIISYFSDEPVPFYIPSSLM